MIRDKMAADTFYDAKRALNGLLREFDTWSKGYTDRRPGWEGNFPQHELLVETAHDMLGYPDSVAGDEESIAAVDKCFSVSGGEMIDVFMERGGIKPIALRLTRSGDPRTRGQALEIMTYIGNSDGYAALRKALGDEDPYVQRVARFNISTRYVPEDAGEMARQLLGDDDPRNRMIALNMAVASRDDALVERTKETLREDPDARAQEYLEFFEKTRTFHQMAKEKD